MRVKTPFIFAVTLSNQAIFLLIFGKHMPQ